MPEYDAIQEFRLATVMYGGVSLAIYMNGVAQELLRLVRATAPERGPGGILTGNLHIPDTGLNSTEKVYRELGKIIGASIPIDAGVDLSKEPVRTRFVVDILSGTSAGGINGVFLAKALSNQESMDGLTSLWVNEGDFAALLNDSKSCDRDPAWCSDDGPSSLLNSRRMYGILVSALSGMRPDAGAPAPRPNICASPYVNELDLFVTTTDILGLVMPIQLKDQLIFERRYRNYYHFRYGFQDDAGAAYNNFHAGNTPFLAFAARCTSAFPFAFEAMNLGSALTLSSLPKTSPPAWQPFYSDYVRAANTNRNDGVDFESRYFIDGGCLDNKPFSYSIDALRWRRADVPVRRTLLYIEPSPAHPELVARSRKPDAFDTVYSGYVDLPRVENIRDDLERLIERNKMAGRVQQLIDNLDADVKTAGFKHSAPNDVQDWLKTPVSDFSKKYGAPYAAYHKLKTSAVTDDVANIITCAAGLDVSSGDALAVRYLVRAYRNANYEEVVGEPGCESHYIGVRFLMLFDLDYRVRKVSFVRQKLDKNYSRETDRRNEISTAKRAINEVRRGLLRTHAIVSSPDNQRNPLLSKMAPLADAFGQIVERILSANGQATASAHAEEVYNEFKSQFDDLAQSLHEALERGIPNAGESVVHEATVESVLHDSHDSVGFANARKVIREALDDRGEQALLRGLPPDPCGNRLLDDYYEHYETYDAVTFPILAGTGIGEPTTVDIVRVSPEDARRITDQRLTRKVKLAGESLGHFGGFLDRSWRQNDILWGRLDAVERIIDGLGSELPAEGREDLVRRAHVEVLRDAFPQDDPQSLYLRIRPDIPRPAGALLPPLTPTTPRTDDMTELTAQKFVQSVEDGATKGLGEVPPKAAVQMAGRAARVTGALLEGIAKGRDFKPPLITAPARLGSILCSLVDMAVPDSLGRLLARHWLNVIYLIEAFLIVGGLIFNNPTIQDFGWRTLWVTLAIDAAVFLLEMKMRGRSPIMSILRPAALVLLLVLVAVFVSGAAHIGSDVRGLLEWATRRVMGPG